MTESHLIELASILLLGIGAQGLASSELLQESDEGALGAEGAVSESSPREA